MSIKLKEELATLSVQQKVQLIDQLWGMVADETENEPISDEMLEELDRRSAAFDADPTTGVTMEELEKRLFPRN